MNYIIKELQKLYDNTPTTNHFMRGSLPLGDNSDVVKNKVRETFRGIPEEQIKKFVIYGTPEDVSIQIQMLEEVGIQYLIVDLEPSRELTSLDTFANKVINKMS